MAAPAKPALTPLVRLCLLTGLAMGSLTGLAEATRPYALLLLSERWRSGVATTIAGLAETVAAAVAVDTVLVLLGAILWLAIFGLLRAALKLSADAPWSRFWTRAVLIGAPLVYLSLGWLILFILLPADRGKLEYKLILAVALVGSGSFGAAVAAWLGNAERSGRRRQGSRLWLYCVIVFAGVLLPLFWRHRASLPPALVVPAIAAATRPNILLVTLDTLRVDYLGCYGHPWIKTPNIDALAAHGTQFLQAIAQAPSTGPSHTSIFTSLYPFDHGAENGRPLKPGLVTLADLLRAIGYETVAFTSSTTTRSLNSGLQQGFERYSDSLVTWSELFGFDSFQNLISMYLIGIAQQSQIPGEYVSNRALSWLESRDSDRPFFCWLHYFDPHAPYGAPAPFADAYRGKANDGLPMATERERYAEDVSYTDHQLGRVLDALRREGLLDNLLIVVTSDHGEAFGETHGDCTEKLHGRFLYDTTQHVPLIIQRPGERGPGRRVAELVELTDLAPTILDFLEAPAPEDFVGKSLLPLLTGKVFEHSGRDGHAFNIIDVPSRDAGGGVMFVQQLAIRSPTWKYIAVPYQERAELYDLQSDPRERHNLARERIDVARNRHAAVMPFWDAARDTSDDPRQRLAPALVRQLQALGYLGGADTGGAKEGEHAEGDDDYVEPEDPPDSAPAAPAASQPAKRAKPE